MNVPVYIRKKMTFRECVKFWYTRKRVAKMTKKMDHHISKAKKYEDLMYKSDDEFVECINKLCMKYA